MSWKTRPRLIKTGKCLKCVDRDSLRRRNFLDVKTEKYLGCQNRNSSRLGNLMDVEIETSRDWGTDVDTETLTDL